MPWVATLISSWMKPTLSVPSSCAPKICENMDRYWWSNQWKIRRGWDPKLNTVSYTRINVVQHLDGTLNNPPLCGSREGVSLWSTQNSGWPSVQQRKCASQCLPVAGLRGHVSAWRKMRQSVPGGGRTCKPLGHMDVILPDLISNMWMSYFPAWSPTYGCYTSQSDLQRMDVKLPDLWTLGERYIVLALRGQNRWKLREDKTNPPIHTESEQPPWSRRGWSQHRPFLRHAFQENPRIWPCRQTARQWRTIPCGWQSHPSWSTGEKCRGFHCLHCQ